MLALAVDVAVAQEGPADAMAGGGAGAAQVVSAADQVAQPPPGEESEEKTKPSYPAR
jgi:hypothetical protein